MIVDLLLIATLALEPTTQQAAEAPLSQVKPAPRCALERSDASGYLAWICDPEGRAYSETVALFHVRKTRWGGEAVSRVWRGPLRELAASMADIIKQHRNATAHCAAYFHVATVELGALAWGRPTHNMRQWWEQKGGREFGRLCYTDEPAGADFVIIWSDGSAHPSHSFAALPRTSPRSDAETVDGSTERDVGTGHRGTSDKVAAISVYPVDAAPPGSRLGLPVTWPDGGDVHSVPGADTQGLAEALKLIARQI
jgi:hypothetical protein